jgi:hypothetical protein
MVCSLLLVHAWGGVADGVSGGDGSTLSPVSRLGTLADLRDCVTAPLEVGSATAAFCDDWDAVVDKDGVVEVVSLHALDDSGVVDGFRGTLPMGLAWGDSIADVREKLGEPARITSIYKTPTFVYMYRNQAFGSLELRFSAGGRLTGINVCLER